MAKFACVTSLGPSTNRIEAVLRQAFGSDVEVTGIEPVDPWCVLKVSLSGDQVPASVVVKYPRDPTGDFRTDPQRICRERAGLEFIADTIPDLAPALIAADTSPDRPDQNFLIMEDLSPRISLRDLLLREGAAKDQLDSYTRALARLHAATVGNAEQFGGYVKRLGLGDVPVDHSVRMWRAGLASIRAASVSMPTSADSELAEIVAAFATPGSFLAFSNGDAQQNNYLTDDNGDGRVIDFEDAGFRHTMLDLMNLYIPGSMWLSVGDPITNGQEEIYRKELVKITPEVADDRLFGAAISGAVLIESIGRLADLAKLDARPAGDNSRVHRIAALEAAANTSDQHHSFPALAAWARRRRRPFANSLAGLRPRPVQPGPIHLPLVGGAASAKRWDR